MKENMKSLGWGILALLTCPCHLVFMIPLLAGTTLGAYLVAHQTIAGIVLAIIFAISLCMMFRRITKQENSANDCCFPKRKRGESA